MGGESIFSINRKSTERNSMLRWLSFPEILIQIYIATIIDKHWLITSRQCCSNSDNYQIIFDDSYKSKWIFQGSRKQRRICRNRRKCMLREESSSFEEIDKFMFFFLLFGYKIKIKKKVNNTQKKNFNVKFFNYYRITIFVCSPIQKIFLTMAKLIM